MFRILLKTSFLSIFHAMFRGTTSKKKTGRPKTAGMKLLFALLGIYVVVVFMGLFGMIFSQICEPFHQLEIDWLYFAITALMALLMMLVGSIFVTYAQLYEAKDNELLLSMPIQPKYILASRMVMLYLFNMFFELMIIGPAAYTYQEAAGYSAAGVVSTIFMILFLPFLSLAISCILGWVIAVVCSHMRNKSLFTMILSFGFLVGYFYLNAQMSRYLNYLIEYALRVADAVKGAVLPLYWFGEAMASGNFFYLGLCILISVVPFVIVYAALSVSFIRLATTKRGYKKIQYRARELKVSSIDRALLNKELKHFLGSPSYIMNATLGSIFTVVVVGAMVIKHSAIQSVWSEFEAQMPQLSGNAGIILAIVLAGICSMNVVTAPSISLEGKNLWILHSFPIHEKSILKSKLNLQLMITMPPIIAGELVGLFLFKMNLWNVMVLLIAPIAINYLWAALGLIINLHFPKFDWISETIAVKQSASVLFSIFANMGITMAIVMLYALVLSDYMSLVAYGVIATVLFTILSILLYVYLMKRGTKILRYL